MGFLRAAEREDYTEAAKFLDTKASEKQAAQLALELKALLDLGTSTDLNTISRVPEGDLTDKLRTSRERVGVVSTPNGPLDVLLDRIERPNEEAIWLFSQETLRKVPDAYDSVHHQDLGAKFPPWMSRVNLFSIPLWRLLLMLASLGGVLLLASLLTRIVLRLLRWTFRSRMTEATKESVLKLRAPIFGLMTGLIEHIFSGYSLTVLGRSRWNNAAALTVGVCGAWLAMRLTDIFTSYVSQQLRMRLQNERATLLSLVARFFKIFIGIVLVIALLSKAGVDVTALITGLGIGGVALAFAAQKTLSDLFGGVSIVMRGAVRVGDFCTIAGKQGTVEEIGISALRMRTPDRTVITIPNSKVAEMDLENFTMRDQFWVHQVFTLRFDTPSAVVDRVLRGMRDVLQTHPDIDPATARVRLVQLTNAGPQVEVFAYYRKPLADFPAFLVEQEKIILEMLRLVEEQGTAMAAPIGVIQLGREGFATVQSDAGTDS